jgi:hypothetical protein
VTPLFNKLNLGDARVVHVLNAPASFDSELQALKGVKVIHGASGKIMFALAFVKTIADVEAAAAKVVRAADADAVLWMVYPKGSSKKYQCEFNRDTGWQALGKAGYEPVRQVAVDEDWSALRFRNAAFIKTMIRNPQGAISAAGRKKARAQRKR